ncbi:MAG: hypothetical protein A3G25_10290 [Betaproteobacteria bacterium RIFCSPLOWO2_12_FULL_63_13]|nr:MAG: hypothetical protein A3G25_10290 [Betaproteobacteria bacterium RIFCSPLOWO2_12_FULL_63_13]
MRRANSQDSERVRAHTREPVHPAARRTRVVCAVLFVFLMWTAAQSAMLGAAHFLAQLAHAELQRWSSGTSPVALWKIRRVEEYLENSLRYSADNPWALEAFAALDLARMRASAIPRQALAEAQDARERLRRALRQRPTSPYLWANLALAKLYLDKIDDEFLNALRSADQLGPWEPTIQQMTVFAGLAAWGRLDAALKQALKGSVERAGARDAAKMYEIVKKFRRFDLICVDTQYNELARQDCKQNAGPATPGKR